MESYRVMQVAFSSPEYDDCIKLRNEHLRQPLNLEYTSQQIEEEWSHFHFGLYDSALFLIGCLVFQPLSNEVIKMRQVVIEKNFQNSGLGKLLVSESEKWAKLQGYKLIELHARDLAVPFYKSLDYSCVGEPFVEVSILHFKMEKELNPMYEKN